MTTENNNLLFEDFQTPAMAIDDEDTFELLSTQCTDWPELQLLARQPGPGWCEE